MKYQVQQIGHKGRGIYACQKIVAFEVIKKVEYFREVNADELLRNEENYGHQIYLPDGRIFLVAEPIFYFNHSCQPSDFLYSADQQYYIISKRSISINKEITIDYEPSAIDGNTWECRHVLPEQAVIYLRYIGVTIKGVLITNYHGNYTDGLENRCGVIPTGGSNPSSSAHFRLKPAILEKHRRF